MKEGPPAQIVYSKEEITAITARVFNPEKHLHRRNIAAFFECDPKFVSEEQDVPRVRAIVAYIAPIIIRTRLESLTEKMELSRAVSTMEQLFDNTSPGRLHDIAHALAEFARRRKSAQPGSFSYEFLTAAPGGDYTERQIRDELLASLWRTPEASVFVRLLGKRRGQTFDRIFTEYKKELINILRVSVKADINKRGQYNPIMRPVPKDHSRLMAFEQNQNPALAADDELLRELALQIYDAFNSGDPRRKGRATLDVFLSLAKDCVPG